MAASSSSGALPPLRSSQDISVEGEGGDFDKEPTTQFTLIDHGFGQARAQLLNSWTFERAQLPVGTWTVVDDDGWAAASCSNPGTKPILAEDVFKKIVGKREGGDGYIVVDTSKAGRATTFDLSSWLQRFDEVDLELKLDVVGADLGFKAAQLFAPRQGMRIWWCGVSIYKALRFTTYKKVPSTWASRSFSAWRKATAQLGFEPSHALASRVILSAGAAQAVADPDRFLPCFALPTLGFLLCLSVWCSDDPGNHGLRSEDRRDSCTLVLRNLCLAAAAAKPAWMLGLRTLAWRCVWPASEPSAAQLFLAIDPTGAVHLDVLRAYAAAGNDVAVEWWSAINKKSVVRAIEQAGRRRYEVDLWDLLVVAASCTDTSLIAQLVWFVARRLETVVLGLSGTESSFKLVLKRKTLETILGDARLLDYELLRYMLSNKATSSGRIRWSMSLDKANVAALQLLTGYIGSGDNEVIVSAPQVGGPSRALSPGAPGMERAPAIL